MSDEEDGFGVGRAEKDWLSLIVVVLSSSLDGISIRSYCLAYLAIKMRIPI